MHGIPLINFLPAAILGTKSNATVKHDWSMAAITVKLSRVTIVNNLVQRRLVDDLFERGTSQLFRFHELGQLADPEDAVSRLRLAVKLVDDGRPAEPKYFFILGLAQMECYERLGELLQMMKTRMCRYPPR
jgi:hypothetical protein